MLNALEEKTFPLITLKITLEAFETSFKISIIKLQLRTFVKLLASLVCFTLPVSHDTMYCYTVIV